MCESQVRAAGAAAPSQLLIPSFETFRSFGVEHKISVHEVEKCWQYYSGTGWRDSRGDRVANWQAKLLSWKNSIRAADLQPAPVSPEESQRKEADRRRKQVIRMGAERIVALRSWIESGEKCPYWDDPHAEIDQERGKIEKQFGPSGLIELDKDVVKVTEEKRVEAERQKARE